ncbi:1-acyl-sn-glycerol-3-phosphate acyltransferase [Sunxiuqinia sp. A32]|uniref:1-acyl-sn-glycerol-3-phosphate acyltransferase n=1 Tax=Sunxiuqinia sp. A32 TaxID=3461496 RepID=UPI0040467C9E
MEKWSLGYAVLKVVVQFAMWLSHRKITVIGKKNIPYGSPIIFAPNHQNALMDPLAILCTNKTQPVWLARADIFNSKFVVSILKFLKILPIYRIRDGKDNLGKNEDIFDTAIKVLENNKAVGLFPEAAHSGRRHMLAHKKAVPRIAFLAEAKHNFNLNLKVLPVGVYYSHYWHFNRSILINYGEPIKLSDYKKEYEENDYKAALTLRQDIVSNLQKLILDIPSKNHYENYELLREIWGEEYVEINNTDKNKIVNRFYSDRKLMDQLDRKEKENPESFVALHQTVDGYREKLDEYHLKDETVKNETHIGSSFTLKTILAITLTPVLILGNVLFLIPFWLPRWYIQRKVKDDTFYSTFQFVAGLITHFIFLVATTIVMWTLTNNILISLSSIFIILFVGKLSFYILELWKEIIQITRFRLLRTKNKGTYLEIKNSRKNCIHLSSAYVFD